MLCSRCSSWVHLVRYCLDRVHFSSNYFEADQVVFYTVNEHQTDDTSQILLMDKSIEGYFRNESDYKVEPTDNALLLSLAHNIDQEFGNPRNEYYYHESTYIGPDTRSTINFSLVFITTLAFHTTGSVRMKELPNP